MAALGTGESQRELRAQGSTPAAAGGELRPREGTSKSESLGSVAQAGSGGQP